MKRFTSFFFASITLVLFATAVTMSTGLSLAVSVPAAFALSLLVSIPAGSLAFAVVQNPLIGKSRQKMGGAVFSTWKGINVLKTKPLTVANPNTPAQQLQRAKLSLAVETYRKQAGIINEGFAKEAIKQSAYNAFVSDMIKNAITGADAASVAVDWANLDVAKGTMSPTVLDSVTATDGSANIDFTYPTAATGVGQSATDTLRIAAFNSTTGDFCITNPTDPRSIGSDSFDMSNPVSSGDSLYVYLFFVSADGSMVSDSTVTNVVVS